MHVDMTINLGNILTIFAMIGSIIGILIKFRDDINLKADKDIVDRIKGNLDILLSKIEISNEKLDDIKANLKIYKDKYDKLYEDFLVIKTEHERIHK